MAVLHLIKFTKQLCLLNGPRNKLSPNNSTIEKLLKLYLMICFSFNDIFKINVYT